MKINNRKEAEAWVRTWGNKMRKGILGAAIEGQAAIYALSTSDSDKENVFSVMAYLMGVSGRLYGDKQQPNFVKFA